MWMALLTAAVIYQPPPAAPSCALLKHREIEREKVIREHAELNTRDPFRVNQLLTNKLFMPGDTWRDETVNVRVSVDISEALEKEIDRVGLDQIYLSLKAPGLVWESYAFQTPAGYDISMDGEGHLILNYLTYQNVMCLADLPAPVLEWMAN